MNRKLSANLAFLLSRACLIIVGSLLITLETSLQISLAQTGATETQNPESPKTEPAQKPAATETQNPESPKTEPAQKPAAKPESSPKTEPAQKPAAKPESSPKTEPATKGQLNKPIRGRG